MTCPVSVTIHAEPTDHRAIRKNGFISCFVTFQAPRFVSKRMGFCLHRKELFSYNGALKHTKQLAEKHHVNLTRLFYPDKIDFYKQQIVSDAEIVWDKWHLKETGFPKDSNDHSHHDRSEFHHISEICSQQDATQTAEGSCVSDLSSHCSDGQPEIIERDRLFEEQWDCLEECLLTRWSCFSSMNSSERFEEAEAVMKSLFVDISDKKRNLMKSRVISLMLKQLSSRLSLSKNQNDQLLSFLKKMIIFIAPEKIEIARRIFASHTTCQRQSLKDQERKNILCKNLWTSAFSSRLLSTLRYFEINT